MLFRSIKPKKIRKNIKFKDITCESYWEIESTEDLDKYLNNLRKKLEKELNNNTILNIDF